MSESQPPEPPPVRRPKGHPRIDPSGPQVRKSVKLAPAEIDHLTERYGGVHAGLRTLTRRDMDGPGK